MKIARILVPLDLSPASEAALRYALALQDKYDAELYLVHVIENVEYLANMYLFEVPTLPPMEDIEREHRELFDEFVKTHVGDRPKVTASLQGGKPFVEILKYANEIDADVIVITSHGRSGFEHAMFGSTTEKVMRKSRCPVLVVRIPEVVA